MVFERVITRHGNADSVGDIMEQRAQCVYISCNDVSKAPAAEPQDIVIQAHKAVQHSSVSQLHAPPQASQAVGPANTTHHTR